MSVDLALVDTNVLVYSLYQNAEHHQPASALLDQGQAGQLALCVTAQVLAELFAVITDRRRVNHPFSSHEARDIVQRVLAMPGMVLLPTPVDCVARWLSLVEQHPVRGGELFDVQLAATLLGNGVTRIYTYDRPHFERFTELDVLTP
jgi:toxin-antitoxin system PIN domain toxin